MSHHAYNQFAHMSGTAEHGLTRHALNAGRAKSAVATIKRIFSVVGKSLIAIFDYMVDVTEALDEARARDPRYSRSLW